MTEEKNVTGATEATGTTVNGVYAEMTGLKKEAYTTKIETITELNSALKVMLADVKHKEITEIFEAIEARLKEMPINSDNTGLLILLNNLMQFCYDIYVHSQITYATEFSADNPEGIKMPNLANYNDILSDLNACFTEDYSSIFATK